MTRDPTSTVPCINHFSTGIAVNHGLTVCRQLTQTKCCSSAQAFCRTSPTSSDGLRVRFDIGSSRRTHISFQQFGAQGTQRGPQQQHPNAEVGSSHLVKPRCEIISPCPPNGWGYGTTARCRMPATRRVQWSISAPGRK